MLKRTIDLVLALAGLVVLLPAFAVVAVIVRLSSPGPVLFRQIRVGLRGREFVLVKFRTMTTQVGSNVREFDAGNTSRVTKAGAFLRRTKLDELPQLWNVVRG